MGSMTRSGNAFNPDPAQVRLEPAHHDRFEIPRAHLDATCEALRVEHLKQRREAVGVPVVWRRGQEEPVLEALGQFACSLGELAIDRVSRPAGRGRVVRLVDDQERPRAEVTQHVAQ